MHPKGRGLGPFAAGGSPGGTGWTVAGFVNTPPCRESRRGCGEQARAAHRASGQAGLLLRGRLPADRLPLSNCVHSGIEDAWVLQQYRVQSLNDQLDNGRPWDLDRTHSGLRLLPPQLGAEEARLTDRVASGRRLPQRLGDAPASPAAAQGRRLRTARHGGTGGPAAQAAHPRAGRRGRAA